MKRIEISCKKSNIGVGGDKGYWGKERKGRKHLAILASLEWMACGNAYIKLIFHIGFLGVIQLK